MSRFCHRLLTQLALLAIVLLATVPTVARMVSGGAAHAEHAPRSSAGGALAIAAHASHDMSGMRHMSGMHHMPGMAHAMAMPPAPADAERGGPAPHPAGDPHAGHGIDCDYCPLLHSLLGALALVLRGTGEGALPAPAVPLATTHVPWHYPAGLGSRGPPALS